MKNKRLKKTTSFILLLAMVFSCTAISISCSKDTSSNTNNNSVPSDTTLEEASQGTTEDESQFDPKLPSADYGGEDFRILNIDQDTMWWSIVDLDVESETGDVVNDAIYQRNRNIEAKYNFVIKETKSPSDKVNTSLRNSVKAGSDDYDLVSPTTNSAPSLAMANCLVDLNKVPHLNFSNPWWNNSVSSYFSFNGKLFFTCSDFTLTDDDNVTILMYNKKLAENLGIDGADALYALVDEGKWTYAKFAELCKVANADLNGDGEIKGAEDRFGLSVNSWFYIALLGGFNETIIKKDANDLPYISCKTERFGQAYTDMVTFMGQRDTVVREFEDTPNIKTEEMFVNDKALFCGQVLSCVRLYKNMGSDFGLLPLPKYDESQKQYCTYSLWSSCLAIPTTNSNLEKTGLILEALSAESRRLVVPAYYEVSIGTKYLRDEASFHMLDVILENRIYDINESMYNWGGFSSAFSTAAKKGDTNFTSLIEKYETKIETAMQKTIDTYSEME